MSVFISTRTRDDAHRRCAELVVESLNRTRESRSTVNIAWCGGASAHAVLSALANDDLSDTHWYPTDERCVPIGHPDRNDSLLHQLLVESGRVPVERIHSIPAELGPIAAAVAYDRQLESCAEFDVALLSLGPDGHVASLFPDHPALESTGNAIGVTDSPKPPAERVTLTVGRLASTHVRIVVAVGAEKEQAARDAIQRGRGPAARISPTHWVLDRKVASQ